MAINSNFRTLTADNIEGVVAPRNYLKNSFENGTTAGWTEMAVTLTSGLPTGTPTISSTAAASIALTNTTTTPLSLSRSLLVTGAAGWTAGQGFISDEFTIDRMDGGKPLTVSFDYERVSGTLNFSGTLGSQTLMVYIYDATAGGANWIQPAGFLGMNQSSGPGRVTATFQSSVVAGQKYRVAVIASQAVGSACSLEFDNFTCSRVTAPMGPVVTDWVSYTPTGNWTSGITYSGKWRRVGDSIEIEARVVVNTTPPATSLTIGIPSQFTIDGSKLSSTEFLTTVFGVGHAYDVSTTVHYNLQAGLSGNGVFLTYQNQLNGSVIGITNTVPFTFAAGDWVDVTFKVPIQGWSSSVQMSNDTDTRVVSLSASRAQAAVTGGANITGFTTLQDTHGAFNASTGIYTIPVTGDYVVAVSGALPLSASCSISTIYDGSGVVFTNTATAGSTRGGSSVLLTGLPAGKTISFRSDVSTTLSGEFRISIHRLSGPSVIAASETVAAKYYLAGAVSTSPTQPINFATKSYDTHNAVTIGASWRFNTPVSGLYRISNVFVNGSLSAFDVALYLNGSIAEIMTSGDNSRYWNGTTSLRLNAGDYIDLRCTAPTTTASVTAQRIVIERIGN